MNKEKIQPYNYRGKTILEQDIFTLMNTFQVPPGETIKGLIMAMPLNSFMRFKGDFNIEGRAIHYNSITGLRVVVIEYK